MPLYSVTRWFSTCDTLDIEADNVEDARDKASDYDTEEQEALGNMELTDCEVELSDNQYTAEQELADGEQRHEDEDF